MVRNGEWVVQNVIRRNGTTCPPEAYMTYHDINPLVR